MEVEGISEMMDLMYLSSKLDAEFQNIIHFLRHVIMIKEKTMASENCNVRKILTTISNGDFNSTDSDLPCKATSKQVDKTLDDLGVFQKIERYLENCVHFILFRLKNGLNIDALTISSHFRALINCFFELHKIYPHGRLDKTLGDFMDALLNFLNETDAETYKKKINLYNCTKCMLVHCGTKSASFSSIVIKSVQKRLQIFHESPMNEDGIDAVWESLLYHILILRELFNVISMDDMKLEKNLSLPNLKSLLLEMSSKKVSKNVTICYLIREIIRYMEIYDFTNK